MITKLIEDNILMCVRCLTKCHVIIGAVTCPYDYYTRILPEQTFLNNVTLTIANKTLLQHLWYKTHEDSGPFYDALESSATYDQLFANIISVAGILTCVYILTGESKESIKLKDYEFDPVMQIHFENPQEWGKKSLFYSEC